MKKTNLVWITVAALALSACAKDKDLDDWNREKLQKDLSQLQSASGRYSGVVTSKADGKTLGAVQITLTSQVKASSGSATSKAEGAAILVAKVEFAGKSSMSVVAQDSYFNVESKQYQANVPVVRSNGTTEQLTLSGRIESGRFVGSIEALGQSDFGGTFSLIRDGESLASLASASKAGSGKEGEIPVGTEDQERFDGVTRFQSGETVPVSVVVYEPSKSSEEDFLSLFSPIKVVHLTFNYGDSLRMVHEDAVLNQSIGTLIGRSELSRDGLKIPLNLDCQTRVEKTGKGWSCRHRTTANGQVAITEFGASAAPSSGNDKVDWGQAAVIQQFEGEAIQGGVKIPVLMQATYPARTREEVLSDIFLPRAEIKLQITLRFFSEPNYVYALFDQTQWDQKATKLDGRAQIIRDGSQFDLTLKCSQFTFDQAASDFDCLYQSNWSGPIQMHFKK